jgi:hypothetical protein
MIDGRTLIIAPAQEARMSVPALAAAAGERASMHFLEFFSASETKLGNHSFRATGIIAYLKNGGTLEKTTATANHASTRATPLYDRRSDEVTLDKVERIAI